MSEAIPEDLMEKAWRVPRYYGSENQVKAFAKALLAERKETIERCAKVAEAAGDTWSNSRDVSTCIQEAAIDVKCEQIAAAIRSLGRE